MKFIKLTLSTKKSFILPMEQAERLIDAPQQVVQITDEQGEWTGETLNKSFLVSTERDYEAEREWSMRNPLPELPELELTEEQKTAIETEKRSIAEMLRV